MDDPTQIRIQKIVFDFALSELVCQYRSSFKPLWTVESWAKFLTMIAIRCGMSVDKESLEMFANALGPSLTGRMRRQFFERNLEELELKLMADPSEECVLVMPIAGGGLITFQQAMDALELTRLLKRVDEDQKHWQSLNSLVAIPWKKLGNV